MQLSLLELVCGTTTFSLAAGMLQFTVAGLWNAGTNVLHRTFLVVMAIPTPESSWGLLAVDPDVAEMLAVVAPCEASLGFVSFNI
jgi:hypothetical protein